MSVQAHPDMRAGSNESISPHTKTMTTMMQDDIATVTPHFSIKISDIQTTDEKEDPSPSGDNEAVLTPGQTVQRPNLMRSIFSPEYYDEDSIVIDKEKSTLEALSELDVLEAVVNNWKATSLKEMQAAHSYFSERLKRLAESSGYKPVTSPISLKTKPGMNKDAPLFNPKAQRFTSAPPYFSGGITTLSSRPSPEGIIAFANEKGEKPTGLDWEKLIGDEEEAAAAAATEAASDPLSNTNTSQAPESEIPKVSITTPVEGGMSYESFINDIVGNGGEDGNSNSANDNDLNQLNPSERRQKASYRDKVATRSVQQRADNVPGSFGVISSPSKLSAAISRTNSASENYVINIGMNSGVNMGLFSSAPGTMGGGRSNPPSVLNSPFKGIMNTPTTSSEVGTAANAVYTPSSSVVTSPGGKQMTMLSEQRNGPCQVLVEFKRKRILQFESRQYVAPGEYVVVGGDRGEDIGLVTHTWAAGTAEPTGKWGGNLGVGKVLRPASVLEVSQLQGVQSELEVRAVEVAQERVLEHTLPMKIVDAEYQFDRKKLTFYYQSNHRLDFRNLVRDLYKTFRARIWMEQD